jgi:membrane-bound serine protease (ClpP class)
VSPLALVILFFAAGLVLLLAEVVLPTHGVLGVVGVVALLAAVGVCFWIHPYAGLTGAVVLMALTPFAGALWVKVWPKTFAGKRLILGPTAASHAHVPAAPVAVGQLGVVVSELRPGGVCEFGMTRVEARCEHGTIPAGRHVEVVAVSDGRPLVRAV